MHLHLYGIFAFMHLFLRETKTKYHEMGGSDNINMSEAGCLFQGMERARDFSYRLGRAMSSILFSFFLSWGSPAIFAVLWLIDTSCQSLPLVFKLKLSLNFAIWSDIDDIALGQC